MRRLSALFTYFFLFAVSLYAQENRKLSREAIDSLRNRETLENGNSILRFDEYTRDMGVVFENDTTLLWDFAFTNISGQVVVITNVVTNCGCTSSVVENKEIEPGESGVVTVKFNPRHRSGTVDTNAFVYTVLSATRPVAKLTLLGNVVDRNEWSYLPFSMGNLRLKSKAVVFEQVKMGTKPQMRIVCANVGTIPIRITSQLLPEFAALFTEPAELAPGEEGDIVVVIDSSLLPRDGCSNFEILVDGVEGRVSDRMLKVKIKNITE